MYIIAELLVILTNDEIYINIYEKYSIDTNISNSKKLYLNSIYYGN